MASKKKSSGRQKSQTESKQNSGFITAEILLIVFFLISLLLFLSNFGGDQSIIGNLGNALRGFQIGFFGVVGYVFPIAFFLMAGFCISNYKNPKAWLKILAIVLSLFSLCTLIQALFEGESGGIAGAFLCDVLGGVVGKVGTVIIMLFVLVISVYCINSICFKIST